MDPIEALASNEKCCAGRPDPRDGAAGDVTAEDLPWVTVVTPSFNQGAFIEETIRSVLDQDYPRLDLRVVDGGSRDGTLEILKRYAASHPGRFSWISEPDRGQADAVNKGFRVARGGILGWVNSDDTLLPGAVALAAAHFAEHPEHAMVYGRACLTDEDGAVTGEYPTEHPFDPERLAEACYICQPSVFLRRSTFEEVGDLDVSIRTCMDFDYWIRVGQRYPEGVGFIDRLLATSRVYADTKTLGQRGLVHREIIATLWRHYRRVPLRWLKWYALDFAYGNIGGHCRWLKSRVKGLLHIRKPPG